MKARVSGRLKDCWIQFKFCEFAFAFLSSCCFLWLLVAGAFFVWCSGVLLLSFFLSVKKLDLSAFWTVPLGDYFLDIDFIGELKLELPNFD